MSPHLDRVGQVVFAGRGGDGSLTVSAVLARALARAGRHVYLARDIPSRVRGGPATATLRAAASPRYALADHNDLVLALDAAAARPALGRVVDGGIMVHDDSTGALPAGKWPDSVRLYEAPFGRLAVRHLRREQFKNTIALGVVGRLVGLGDEELAEAVTTRFGRADAAVGQGNEEALRLGFVCADDLGIEPVAGRSATDTDGPRLLLAGNEALAFGFLTGGGRFFAGYPITPASEIMVWLERWLPRFGGVVEQCEDELAAINMTLGAALSGVRSMCATSGPGLALMQEAIGQAGTAEIPIVVVDCQRAGGSTGMPTKPEQSDLRLMAQGGHGDFPRVVLTPAHPADCFYLGAAAANLAEQYQCPVLVALDQAVAQNATTLAPFDLDAVTIDRGRLLDPGAVAALDRYARYEIDVTGVSPVTAPGTPGGLWLVTGNEHDEFGRVSTDPANRRRQVDKRMRKLATAPDLLPAARRSGDPSAPVGLIGVGMAFGAIEEAIEILARRGVAAQALYPRTVWPVLKETLAFVAACRRTYVVEHNASGQLADLLVQAGVASSDLVRVLRYDGTPWRPGELADWLTEREGEAT